MRKYGDLVKIDENTTKLTSAQCLVEWGAKEIAEHSFVTETILDILRRFKFQYTDFTEDDYAFTYSVIGDITPSAPNNNNLHIVFITPEGIVANGAVYAVIDDENLLDAVVDMTKTEIEEALGYKINIVEEEGDGE